MKRVISLLIAVLTLTCAFLTGCGEQTGKYAVTLQQSQGGILSCEKTSANEGDEITITAQADYGYYASVYYVNGEESARTFKMPAQDVTVTAQFAEDPDVPRFYVTAESNGQATVQTQGNRFVAGETVEVTVTTALGYVLDCILVDGKAIEGTSFAMPEENVVVSAQVKADETDYKVTAVNDRYGRIMCDVATARAGEQVSVDYYPLDGYVLSYFTLNGEPIELTDGCFTMPAQDSTVSGVFRKEIGYTDTVLAVDCANATSYAHWYFTYTESALVVTVKVIDATPAMAGRDDIQDALELYVATGAEETLSASNAMRIYAWRRGDYKVEVANAQDVFEESQGYGIAVSVTEKDLFRKEGYTGYEMKFVISYDFFEGTYASLNGQFRICMGMRNGETFAKTYYGRIGNGKDVSTYRRVNAYGEVTE